MPTQQRRSGGRPTQTQERPTATDTSNAVESQLNEQQTTSAALARVDEINRVPTAELQRYEAAGFNTFRLVMAWQQCARDLTLAEFLYFMERCVSTGLDPLRKQAYAIKRRDQRSPTGFTVAHQVGIDGFRAIADYSGAYAGSDPPVFAEPIEAPGGKAGHEICRVTVYKIVQGVKVDFTGECRFSEYYPGEGANGAMWRTYPHNQLAKCTEAQALRKAFPVQLGEFEIHGEIGSNDDRAAFVDQLADRATPRAENVRALDSGDREANAAEYRRLYGGDDVPLEQPHDEASIETTATKVQAEAPTTDQAAEPTSPADQMDQLADQVQAGQGMRVISETVGPEVRDSFLPKDAAQDADIPPWEEPAQPAKKMPVADAVRPPNPKVAAAAAAGLCTDPECLEGGRPAKALEGTDPPRCFGHREDEVIA